MITKRSYGAQPVLIVCNFEQDQAIELPANGGRLLLSNYADRCGADQAYRPFEIAIYEL